MITKRSSRFIKIRHHGVVPVPLAQLLKDYFNIDDTAINTVVDYSGISLLDILNATVSMRDVRQRYKVVFTGTIVQSLEALKTYERSGGVQPTQWERISTQAGEGLQSVVDDGNYFVGSGITDVNNGVAQANHGDGYIKLKDLEEMGVWEYVTPEEYLKKSFHYLTDNEQTEFVTKYSGTSVSGTGYFGLPIVLRDSLPICFGTDVWLPKQFAHWLEPQLDKGYTKYVFTNYWAYWSPDIHNIVQDSKYSKASIYDKKATDGQANKGRGSINTINATVYLLHRTTAHLDVRVIDITPLLTNVSTSVGEGGGSFSVQYKDLGAIRAPKEIADDKHTQKKLKKSKKTEHRPLFDSGVDTGITSTAKGGSTANGTSIEKGIREGSVRQRGAKNARGKGGEFYSVENLFYTEKDSFGETVTRVVPPFIHQQCIQNDIILIKFETLKGELSGGALSKFVGKSVSMTDLFPIIGETQSSTSLFSKGVYWDMIGLVDASSITIPSSSGEFSGTINGRCLSKLFDIDANIFYAGAGDNVMWNTKEQQYESFRSKFFLNGETANKHPSFYRMFTALRLKGELQDIAFLKLESVAFWTNYIVEKMSKIAIVRDDAVWVSEEKDGGGGIKISSEAGKPSPTVNDTENWKETARGVWKVVENVIDEQVKNLILNDITLASSTDSIKGMLERIAQAPFVEQWFDTYDNRFNIITRIPPWTRSAYRDNLIFNVENDSLVSFNLQKCTEAYSWYRLKPIFFFGGGEDNYEYYSPTVFFGEYADAFGNSAYEVTSPYVDYGANNDKFEVGFAMAVDQLAWLVETHAYLPFTRTGSITIKGDRTVKKGQCLYLKATDELFYVDSVEQSLAVAQGSATRGTTVSVSRGIVMAHYDKYFDIVNTDVNIYKAPKKEVNLLNVQGNITDQPEAWTKGKVEKDVDRGEISWAVDSEIFSFLLDGEQFVKGGDGGGISTGWKQVGRGGSDRQDYESFIRGGQDGHAPPPKEDGGAGMTDALKKANKTLADKLEERRKAEEQLDKDRTERIDNLNSTSKGGSHRSTEPDGIPYLPLLIKFIPNGD